MLSGCERLGAPQSGPPYDLPPYTSFRDIPGVTADEIKAVEDFLAHGVSFVYGTVPSTETFIDQTGEIRGFTALLCGWLTEMFGIPFEPQLYEWGDMLTGLETGAIDFTGELTATEERRGNGSGNSGAGSGVLLPESCGPPFHRVTRARVQKAEANPARLVHGVEIGEKDGDRPGLARAIQKNSLHPVQIFPHG
jgi:hypothetical protein